MITPGQIRSLKTALRNIVQKDDGLCYIAGKFVQREIASLHELTTADWICIRDQAYPHHRQDDWTVSREFLRQAADYFDEFLVNVKGQQKLF